MATFIFRLQLPLRLARVRRDSHRKELGAVIREILAGEQALADAEADIRTMGAQLLEQAQIGIGGAELRALSEVRDGVRKRIPGLKARLVQLNTELERVRTELLAATREVTVLEKLRRQAFEDWKREQAHREQAMVDDIVLVRRARAAAAAQGERR